MKVYSEISCEARNCQRLINKFLESDIPVKKVKVKGDTLEFCVEDKYLRKCVDIVAKTGVRYSVESRGGAYLAKKLVLRYLSLAITAILVVGGLLTLNKVCFGVKVTCENPQIAAQIDDILKQSSIRPFILKDKIDTKALSMQISKEIEEVGFANCYFDGGTLNISVKEVYVEPDEIDYSRIVADRDCIITRLLVYSGTAVVKIGDVVKAGDTLIEGYIDTAPDTEENERIAVPADGIVYAETAYTKSLAISDKVVQGRRTGESYEETQLYVFGKPIGKRKAAKYERYEYTEVETTFGSLIPITAVTRTYYELETVEIQLSEAQIEEQISLAYIELWQQMPLEAKLLNDYTYKKKVDNLHIIDIYYIIEEKVSIGE